MNTFLKSTNDTLKLGNIDFGLGNKRKLKENEKRSSGKPFSNYDIISNTLIYKIVNRRTFKTKNGVDIYVTSDPDFNANSRIMQGFAKYEVSFNQDVTLMEDTEYYDEKAIVKSFDFKKGVIYQANVNAPTDFPMGLIISIGENKTFNISYKKGGILDSYSMLI